MPFYKNEINNNNYERKIMDHEDYIFDDVYEDDETTTEESEDESTTTDSSSDSESEDEYSEDEIQERYSQFKEATCQYEQDESDSSDHVAHLSEDLDIIFEKDSGKMHFLRTTPINGVKRSIQYGEKFTCIGSNLHVGLCDIEAKKMTIQTLASSPEVARIFKNFSEIEAGKYSVVMNEIADLFLEAREFLDEVLLQYFWENPLVLI